MNINTRYNFGGYGVLPSADFKTPNVGLKQLNTDTVCFSGKKRKSTKQQVFELPAEKFPSSGLRDYLYSEFSKPDNQKEIIELHKEYYSGLRDCETLDEAKTMYPEFKDVIDAKNVDLSKKGSLNPFTRVQNGEIEGLTLDNLSIEILKRYYGSLLSITDENEYFSIDYRKTQEMLKA